MADLIKILVIGVGFLIVIGIAYLVAAKLGFLKPEAKRSRDAGVGAAKETPGARYVVRNVLLPGERAFLPVLEQAVRTLATERQLPVPRVLASVRLAEVLQVDDGTTAGRSGWQSAFNRIQSKQADFLVCGPDDTRPLLVIELDDNSHARQDRRQRDDFIDEACASACLPILHVRAATSYDAKRLASDIAAKLPSRA